MKNGLKELVKNHLPTGSEKAIPGKILASRLGYKDDRIIRLAIRGLIADGLPVAASVQKPYGFFIAETKDEVELYTGVMKSRLIEDAYRRRDFKRAAFLILKPEQTRLF